MKKLSDWRREIGAIHVDIAIPVVVDPTAIALNKPAPKANDLTHATPPRQPTISSLSVHKVIQQKPTGATAGKPTASTVIRRVREPYDSRFFKTTENSAIPPRATGENIEDNTDWVAIETPAPAPM